MSKVSKKTSVDSSSMVLGMGNGCSDKVASFHSAIDWMIGELLEGFNGLFTNETIGIEFPSMVSGSSQPRHIFQAMGLKGNKSWTLRVVAKPIKANEVNSQGTTRYFAIMKSPETKAQYKVLECKKAHFDAYTQAVEGKKNKEQVVSLVPTPTTSLDDILAL